VRHPLWAVLDGQAPENAAHRGTRRRRAGKVHLARGLDGQVPSIPSSEGARRRGGVTGCPRPCHDGWAPSSPCRTGCSTPRRDASRRWRLTAGRRNRGQPRVPDGRWASSTMGDGAIQPLAATPGPLTVHCGATPSSMLLGEGLTAWRRKRRCIPVLDGTQPSNTKLGAKRGRWRLG
jgi:hypothetical protein